MTTTVKATDPAQFLALVPRMLGYVPVQSVVVVPMGAGRSLGGMRLDLPPDDVDTRDGFAATVIGMVCRVTRSDALVAVIYTAAETGDGLPHAALAAAIARAADASGLHLVDVLVQASDGWGSHVSADADIHPLSDLATLDHAYPPAVGDQSSGAILPDYPAAERRRTRAAHRSLQNALGVLCGLPGDEAPEGPVDPSALSAACELDDMTDLFERALAWDTADLSPMHTALLAWVLGRPSLRDIALVQWASDAAGGAQAMEAQLRWEDGEEYPSDLAAVMWGEGVRPEPARLEAALQLVRHVASRTARRDRAGALAVCAWLSWALGRSTHADGYARAALDIDADHGLADIVRSFVAAAHLPDWAFRRGEADT